MHVHTQLQKLTQDKCIQKLTGICRHTIHTHNHRDILTYRHRQTHKLSYTQRHRLTQSYTHTLTNIYTHTQTHTHRYMNTLKVTNRQRFTHKHTHTRVQMHLLANFSSALPSFKKIWFVYLELKHFKCILNIITSLHPFPSLLPVPLRTFPQWFLLLRYSSSTDSLFFFIIFAYNPPYFESLLTYSSLSRGKPQEIFSICICLLILSMFRSS